MSQFKRSYFIFPIFGSLILFAIICIALKGKKGPSLHFYDEDFITLVTYNVSQGFDNSGKVNPHIIYQVLKECQPTIVALQESETMRITSGLVDLVYWLSEKLGMYYYYGPKTIDGLLGVSLLSKIPIQKATFHYLPSERIERVVIEVECVLNNEKILIVVPHLGLSVNERYDQMLWIYNRYRKSFKQPFILMGDFNTEEWENFVSYPYPNLSPSKKDTLLKHQLFLSKNEGEMLKARAEKDHVYGILTFQSELTDSWKYFHPNTEGSYTYWDRRELIPEKMALAAPRQHIDYIFVSSSFTPLESLIINGHQALHGSDHLPLVSKIKLTKPSTH